jgi:hypothetical protein
MNEPFGITFITSPRKRERRFLELCDPISKSARGSLINFFRHFCHARDTTKAIAAAAEHCAQYPHMYDSELAAFKTVLTEGQ